jgi:hypothetical protein
MELEAHVQQFTKLQALTTEAMFMEAALKSRPHKSPSLNLDEPSRPASPCDLLKLRAEKCYLTIFDKVTSHSEDVAQAKPNEEKRKADEEKVLLQQKSETLLAQVIADQAQIAAQAAVRELRHANDMDVDEGGVRSVVPPMAAAAAAAPDAAPSSSATATVPKASTSTVPTVAQFASSLGGKGKGNGKAKEQSKNTKTASAGQGHNIQNRQNLLRGNNQPYWP